MAVKINLLPEVRVVKIKASAQRRLATTVTIVIGLIFTGIVIGLIFIIGYYAAESAQRKSEASNLQHDVDQFHDMELDATTLQEHLKSFSNLNASRVAVTEVFTQLVKTIPPDVSVNSFSLDPNYTATISGIAPSYKELGVFTKALEDYNVSFKPQSDLDRKPIFSNVAITASAKDTTTNAVSYTITFKVDQAIVKNNQDVAQ